MQRLSALLPLLVCCLLGSLLTGTLSAQDAEAIKAAERFDRGIAPLLASYCLDCHSGAEPEGGLDLSQRSTALKGGESGQAIAPGALDESLLWERIDSGEMPPKETLPEEAKNALRQWIADGAVWGADPIDPFRYTTGKRAGVDWRRYSR